MIELHGRVVVLRELQESDAARVREIHATPAVARWWGQPQPEFPFADDPDAIRMTILHDDEIAGMIQFGEEANPDYRHAWIDLFVAPELHNRGIGTEAITTLLSHLTNERGHHRVTIDPAVANEAAIRCYEKAGFSRIGVMHRAARVPGADWHDVLLMELVLAP